jgi:DNA-binding transcriptional ArsR family regulator
LLVGTRGGPTRTNLLSKISQSPMNANQLAREMNLDYTTVRHHLDVLVKNGVLESVGEKYGVVFYPSRWLSQRGYSLLQISNDGGNEKAGKLWRQKKW